MNRLEVIKYIRSGQTLIKFFDKSSYGIDEDIEIWLRYHSICDFSRAKTQAHDKIGPIHCRLWAGGKPHWIHVSPRQVLSFIKRNYNR